MVRTTQGWVVAADSLETGVGGPSKVCKIRHKNGVVLIEWGMAKWDPSPNLWDLGWAVLDGQAASTEELNARLQVLVRQNVIGLLMSQLNLRNIPPEHPVIL